MTRHELDEKDKRYRDLIELAVDAIFMGDPQGNIIAANQSAVNLTYFTRDELLGKNLAILFSEEEQARNPLRYDLLKAGQIVQNERLLTRKDGSTVPVGMKSRMMPDGTYHSFMRDYTEHVADKNEMLSKIVDLEAFTSTVSHDLREPLTSINLSVDILKAHNEKTLDDFSLRMLRNIEATVSDMSEMVENLLILARPEQVQLPMEPVDTTEVISRVISMLAPRIEEADVSVEREALPAIRAPEIYISQIFQNLIGNALNYASTPRSTIKIGGKQCGRHARLFVRDHGPGLSQADSGRIFEVFYRGGNTKAHKGSGLGLAIVGKIARLLGGRAWVEETPGGGCTFYVEIENVIDEDSK